MRCDSPSVEKANSDKDKLLAAFVKLGRGVLYGFLWNYLAYMDVLSDSSFLY